MVRAIQKIGTSRGVILTRDMIEHLGVEDTIEISMEEGRIVLTAPAADALPVKRKISAREAGRDVIEKYRPTLMALADENKSEN